MEKPSLFQTEHGRDAWETEARTNVTRELEELAPQKVGG